MSEQGITREHLLKVIELQKQAMNELHEENTQLRKNLDLLVQDLDNTLHALLCKESYQCEYLDENLSRLRCLIVDYEKGE